MKNLFTLLFLLAMWNATHAQIFSPANGATNVTSLQEVSITFDTPVTKGEKFYNGGITIEPVGSLSGKNDIIDGNKLILPHADFRCATTYTITLAPNTITGQTEPIVWSFTTKAPEPVSYSPVDGATNVAGEDVISVTFDTRLDAGPNFYNDISITPHPDIKIPTKGEFFEDYTLLVHTGTLAAGTTYVVNVGEGVLTGQVTPVRWSFTTKQAAFDKVYPANGMTANLNSETYVQYSLAVEAGANFNQVSISPDPGGVAPSIVGNKLMIGHTEYTAGTTYTVTVPAGAVKNINTDISWSFTAEAVGLKTLTPEGGATNVAINGAVEAEFNNDITRGTSTENISFNPTVAGVDATITGGKLAIAHADFTRGTDYTVTIPANYITGVTAPISWPFSTVGLTIWTYLPDDGAAANAPVVITYESNITQGTAFSDIKITPDPGGVVPTITGNRLTLAHANFAGGTAYTVTIPANAIKERANAFSWTFTTAGPTATTKTPADGATGIAMDAAVSADFNANITSNNNFAGITFSPVVTGVNASNANSRLTINHDAFMAGTEYTVTIPKEAVNGMAEPVTWKFTTKTPAVVKTTPDTDAQNVDLKAAISVEFDNNIAAGTAIGGITISPAAGTVAGTVNGKILTITHGDFAKNTEYTVTLPANTVKGQTTAISWKFKTETLSYQTRQPVAEAKYVGVKAEVSIEFDADIAQGTEFSKISFSPAAGTASGAISNKKLTISHGDFAYGTDYTVTIPANAISGLNSEITWAFATIAPGVASKIPAENATVAPGTVVSVTFNAPVFQGTNFENMIIEPTPAGNITRTITGSTVSIGHQGLLSGKEYTVTIPTEALKGQNTPISWKFTTTAPAVQSKSPAEGETGVAVNTNIAVVFASDIEQGAAFNAITISNNAGTITKSIGGNSLLISHSNNFAAGTDYTVTIPAGAIKGQTDEIKWTFTTITSPPESKNYTPLNGTKGVATNSEISVVFETDVAQGPNFSAIKLEPAAGALTSSINGKKLTIGHGMLAGATEYTVTVPAGAVKGQVDPFTWKFTTVAPTAGTKTPVEGMVGVAVNAGVSVVFDSDIDLLNASAITISPNPGGVMAAATGKTLTIAHSNFAKGTTYTVTIPANTINGIATPISWSFTTIAPEMVSITPAHNTTGVALDAVVSVIFESSIVKGSDINSISISPNPGGVSTSIDGNTLTIRHINNFAMNTTYTVSVPVNALNGLTSEKAFLWTFTTADLANIAKNPADGATGIAIDAPMSLEFNMNPVLSSSPGITITPSAGQVSAYADGKKIIIGHGQFATGTRYTVSVPKGSIRDFTSDILWSFTTVVPGEGVKSPSANATDVALNAEVSIEYDRNFELDNSEGIIIEPNPGNVRAERSGSILKIVHGNFIPGTTYTVTIPANSIRGIGTTTSWSFTTTPLIKVSTTPADGVTNVAVNDNIIATFNINIEKGDNAGAISFSPEVSGVYSYININEGKSLVIAHNNFATGTPYTVTIPRGALKGQNSDIVWTFTTAAPVPQTRTPEGTAVALDAPVSVTFDKNIVIDNLSGISLTPDPGNVVVSNYTKDILTISHADLVPGTTYTVNIAANAIRGISTPYTWQFTAVPLEIISKNPENGAIEVPVAEDFSVEFSLNVSKTSVSANAVFSPTVGSVHSYTEGKKLIIGHGKLSANTTYTITLPANTIKGQPEEVKWSFTTVVVSGIGDMEKLEAKLYPNPVQSGSEFTILTDDNNNIQKIVEIFNASGALVLKTENSNSLIRLTAPKEQGVYLMKITTSDHKVGVYRLVVH